MYHADTYARTITAYDTDQDGVPIRLEPDKPIKGKVVVRVAESDGKFHSQYHCVERSSLSDPIDMAFLSFPIISSIIYALVRMHQG